MIIWNYFCLHIEIASERKFWHIYHATCLKIERSWRLYQGLKSTIMTVASSLVSSSACNFKDYKKEFDLSDFQNLCVLAKQGAPNNPWHVQSQNSVATFKDVTKIFLLLWNDDFDHVFRTHFSCREVSLTFWSQIWTLWVVINHEICL